jgi:hypothetical protein
MKAHRGVPIQVLGDAHSDPSTLPRRVFPGDYSQETIPMTPEPWMTELWGMTRTMDNRIIWMTELWMTELRMTELRMTELRMTELSG